MRSVIDVRDVLIPERDALVSLLRGLAVDDWSRPTECPAWDVHGVALHVLGDDLSLLARQRDAAPNGLALYAADHPGASFRQLLDGFNEQWVHAGRFLGTRLVIDLLGLSGTWTADFYRSRDPEGLGEPVGFFGSAGQPSPWWQVAAREYAERWIHQEQIRRALGVAPVDESLAYPGMEVVIAGFGFRNEELAGFAIGDRTWKFKGVGVEVQLQRALAQPVLSRSLSFEDTVAAMTGDPALVQRLASQTCQNYSSG
jgi:uncharacterized protein (TIGR03083 family)